VGSLSVMFFADNLLIIISRFNVLYNVRIYNCIQIIYLVSLLLAAKVVTNCGYRGRHELWLPWESRIVVTVVLLPVACV
jgi:hypothetical protein